MVNLCVFLVVAFLVYSPCIFGELVFDDMDSTFNNIHIRSGNWKAFLRGPWIGQWRKLSRASFAANVKSIGLIHPDQTMQDPMARIRILFAFHVTNIALHALNGLLLSSVLRGLGVGETEATLGTLFFLVHPLCRDAVAYISSRSVLLSTAFAFGAISLALHGAWPLALPMLWLAFMSKEDTIAVSPCIAALLALKHEWSALAFGAFPLMIAVIYWKGFTRLMETTENTDGRLKAGTVVNAALAMTGFAPIESRWTCFKTTFTETILHFPRWVIGDGLCFDHDIHPSSDLKFGIALAIFSVWATLFILIESFGFRAAWILITIAPLSIYAFTPLRDYLMDLRAYASVAGLALAFALVDGPLWMKWAFLAASSLYTFSRVFDYADPLTFWKGAVRDGGEKKVRSISNLAAMYQLSGDDVNGRLWTEKALALNPNIGVCIVNLALIEARSGNLPRAKELAVEVTTKYPKYVMAWQILGQICNLMKDPAGAQQAANAIAQAGG